MLIKGGDTEYDSKEKEVFGIVMEFILSFHAVTDLATTTTNAVSINVTSRHGHMTRCFTLAQRHNRWSGLLCFFSSLSLRPQYPRLVFPPTLPIILDVITRHNLTHKGKRRLRLETDPSLGLSGAAH